MSGQDQCGQALSLWLSGIMVHSNVAVHGRRQGGASLSSGMWMSLESKIVLEWQFEVIGHCQCRIHPEEWRSPPLEPKSERFAEEWASRWAFVATNPEKGGLR